MVLDEAGRKSGERAILRALDHLTQAMNVCGTVLVLGLMLLIALDVVRRNAINAPLSGVPELVTLSIVAIVFLQSPQALRSGRFPQSELFSTFLQDPTSRLGRFVSDLYDSAGMAITGVIAYATVPVLSRAIERGEFIGSIGDFTAPIWPVKAVVVLGSVVMALQFLARIARRHAAGSGS